MGPWIEIYYCPLWNQRSTVNIVWNSVSVMIQVSAQIYHLYTVRIITNCHGILARVGTGCRTNAGLPALNGAGGEGAVNGTERTGCPAFVNSIADGVLESPFGVSRLSLTPRGPTGRFGDLLAQ